MIELKRAQREIVKAAREFARGEFDLDQVVFQEKIQFFPVDLFAKAGELGFLGVHWPERYEGGGMGLLDQVLVAEAWASYDSSLTIALLTSVLAAEAILVFGREEQREQWLPGVALGKKVLGCPLGQWFDLAVDWEGCCLQLEADPEILTLSGQWNQVLNGMSAQGVVVGFALEQCSGREQMALLLLDFGQKEGVKIKDAGRGLGWNLAPQASMVFEGVQVSKREFLGKGQISRDDLFLLWARQNVLLAGLAAGIAKGSYERALEYVGLREQFGRKLITFPLTRDKLAGMLLQVEQARLMTYSAARSLERVNFHILKKKDRKLIVQAFMAKLTATRAAKEVADQAVQLLGGYGYMREYHVERFYRDAKVCELLFGSSSAHRELIFQLTAGGR